MYQINCEAIVTSPIVFFFSLAPFYVCGCCLAPRPYRSGSLLGFRDGQLPSGVWQHGHHPNAKDCAARRPLACHCQSSPPTLPEPCDAAQSNEAGARRPQGDEAHVYNDIPVLVPPHLVYDGTAAWRAFTTATGSCEWQRRTCDTGVPGVSNGTSALSVGKDSYEPRTQISMFDRVPGPSKSTLHNYKKSEKRSTQPLVFLTRSKHQVAKKTCDR